MKIKTIVVFLFLITSSFIIIVILSRGQHNQETNINIINKDVINSTINTERKRIEAINTIIIKELEIIINDRENNQEDYLPETVKLFIDSSVYYQSSYINNVRNPYPKLVKLEYSSKEEYYKVVETRINWMVNYIGILKYCEDDHRGSVKITCQRNRYGDNDEPVIYCLINTNGIWTIKYP